MKMLDLFAGVGGFTVAAHRLGIETIQLVEIDPDAQGVLRSHWPYVPIHGDIRTYERFKYVDIVSCGFPCTETSRAGARRGIDHGESRLWREGLRILCQVRPKYFVIEQPLGVVDRGLRAVLGGLQMAGYAYEIEGVSARELGGCTRRDRLFVVAYPDSLQGRIETSWADQIGSEIQAIKDSAEWLSVERDGVLRHPRLSDHSSGLIVKSRTKGRLQARILMGKSCSPYQAELPLRRVLNIEKEIACDQDESNTR